MHIRLTLNDFLVYMEGKSSEHSYYVMGPKNTSLFFPIDVVIQWFSSLAHSKPHVFFFLARCFPPQPSSSPIARSPSPIYPKLSPHLHLRRH